MLTDGLGSVRQEMAGGALQTTTTYEPYGNLLTQTGTSGTTYGFTGEQEDAATGLVYLRARYYNPALKLFMSRDPFPGMPTMPATQHGYSYAHNNPVNLTDPTGYCVPGQCEAWVEQWGPSNPRDLTLWLYSEMMTNIYDSRLQHVRSANAAGNIGVIFGAGLFSFGCYSANPLIVAAGGAVALAGGGAYAAAGIQFYNLVADRRPWDFKHTILDYLGRGVTLCSSLKCQKDVEYSVPGNIHFGFVAREGGYHGVVTHIGAGYAEIFDPAHDPNSQFFKEVYDREGKFGVVVGAAGASLNLGDDPEDHQAIQFGIHLYNKYGRGLTYTQFKQELGSFLSAFATNPPDPRPVQTHIAVDWPYWVGYFEPNP